MKLMVVKEFTFDSAHFLPGYDGDCKNLHGHTYKLQIGVYGPVRPESGMVVDFNELKKIMHDRIALMDHACLNDVLSPNFPTKLPTAENIIRWLVYSLEFEFELGTTLALVRLWETPTSYCEWRATP